MTRIENISELDLTLFNSQNTYRVMPQVENLPSVSYGEKALINFDVIIHYSFPVFDITGYLGRIAYRSFEACVLNITLTRKK